MENASSYGELDVFNNFEINTLIKFADNYWNVLHGTLNGLNLIGMKDKDTFFCKQILDSVAPLKVAKKLFESYNTIIDVGFGGGFPLLPLAILNPDKRFIGFEAKKKKVDAVKLICSQLGINNIKVYHQRIEEVLIDQDSLIVLKAVGSCSEYLKKINVSSHPSNSIENNSTTAGTEKMSKEVRGSKVLFYKGPNFRQLEAKDLEKIDREGEWELFLELYYEIPTEYLASGPIGPLNIFSTGPIGPVPKPSSEASSEAHTNTDSIEPTVSASAGPIGPSPGSKPLNSLEAGPIGPGVEKNSKDARLLVGLQPRKARKPHKSLVNLSRFL